MNNDLSSSQETFLETKEYRRFAEFCDACKQHRYIGLCHGYPGVGKTLSAWQYARWHLIQPYFPERFYLNYRLPYCESSIARVIASSLVPFPPEIGESRSILYTPSVTNTPKQVELEIQAVRLALSHLVDTVQNGLPQKTTEEEYAPRRKVPNVTDLIIIDEADRLKMAALEQVRDIYDHGNIGIVLIGMPGLEKRLSRYPQLYSRVGFVHEFRSLNAEESRLFLEQQWNQWSLTLNPENAAEAEAIAAIIRITNGNFRLLNRLLTQIERIANINALRMVSKEVVEIARQQLVIGAS
jgi:DNA transposition AAA+ family ATPase